MNDLTTKHVDTILAGLLSEEVTLRNLANQLDQDEWSNFANALFTHLIKAYANELHSAHPEVEDAAIAVKAGELAIMTVCVSMIGVGIKHATDSMSEPFDMDNLLHQILNTEEEEGTQNG